jgi:hypothetical protein
MEIYAVMGGAGVGLAFAVRAEPGLEDEAVLFPVIVGGVVDIDRVPVGEDDLDLLAEFGPLLRYTPSLAATVAYSVAGIGGLVGIDGAGRIGDVSARYRDAVDALLGRGARIRSDRFDRFRRWRRNCSAAAAARSWRPNVSSSRMLVLASSSWTG